MIVFGADHVYRWTRGRCSPQHIDIGCRRHGGRAFAVRDRGVERLWSHQTPTAGRSRRSWRSRPSRQGCPTTRLASLPRWATTSSPPALVEALQRRRRATSSQARHGRQHRAHCSPSRARRRYTTSTSITCRGDRPRTRLLAGRRDARRLLRGEHGSDRRSNPVSTCTTGNGPSTPCNPCGPRPRSSRAATPEVR